MFKRLLRSQQGISLVETLASLAIGAIVVGGLVATMHQVNLISRVQGDSLGVAGQVQNAMAVLNHDLMGATAGTVTQEQHGESLTLFKPSYTFGENSSVVTGTVTYRCVDQNLVRDDGDSTVTVARDITFVDFGPAGPIGYTTVVTVTSGLGDSTLSKTVTINRRPDSNP